ncbi:MAG: iron-sulfur cluster repair di-iron protein [Bacteroidales bacterium]|nr:iron-sulfur cluster repair di-iron protein [Bacteroidales bacterium]
METQNLETRKIGDIVTDNFKAAEIFKRHGIDFCCGGNTSLQQACDEKKLDVSILSQELQNLADLPPDNSHNFKEWKLDFLCDYIVNTHHSTVNKLLPQLLIYTRKIADVHGHHAELIQIADLFAQLHDELLTHLKSEEEILFPAIKDVLKTGSDQSRETIKSEISRMSKEHEFAGAAMDNINKLSSNYLLPPDACNTYAVTYKLLEQFEDDLHIHVHLENHILYPKALEL